MNPCPRASDEVDGLRARILFNARALISLVALVVAPRIALGDTNVSREVSIYNAGRPFSAPNGTEAISREVSVFNFRPSSTSPNGIEAISREVSAFDFGRQNSTPNGVEAVSREISLFDAGRQFSTPNGIEAISREVSLFSFPLQSTAPNGIEALSREVSVFSFGRLSSAPNGIEADSREVSFYNFGSNLVTIAIGSTIVPVGTTGAVSVAFSTLIPLTNVVVAVGFPANSLTNWTVAAQFPLIGSAIVSNNNQLYASFGAPLGQSITTNLQQLGQLVFTPDGNQRSAFLPLLVDGVQSKILHGFVGTETELAQNGEVVVLNTNSLLRWTADSNGLEFIKLYGYAGTNYTIESATNLRPPVAWTPVYSSLLTTNFIATTPDVIMSNPVIFFRAKQ